MKKTFVLVVLFVLPIVAYLFFASGVTNFGKLAQLTKDVHEIDFSDQAQFKGKITVLGFLGSDVEGRKGNAFNLNQKIYKRFYEFGDFQFVMLISKDQESEVEALKTELATLADNDKWNFVYASDEQINSIFKSLKTDIELDAKYSTPYVFIVDKDLTLRGRSNDEDDGTKYGFNSNSVADLNNKMVDDVKIILAEYRLALKKNNPDSAK
ncbi:redoxin domain-containing protein [Maribacter sp. Hel_I_7]|uniref:redoxin domain-containing protein n=1 Tax=Maribacter sp. Hel_I_7 TaxID=1249997 RepID=UPI00047D9381|nr:redoxin domain-containing protein [Maribacter sp. Hel_I_7]|tara:strand:- start:128 stop:757 length:630 start_codon:yes stop_codon:yes gene_type:complete